MTVEASEQPTKTPRPWRFREAGQERPQAGQLWQHEGGNVYRIVGLSRDTTNGAKRVLYVAWERTIGIDPWDRRMEEFIGEVQNEAGEWVPRFIRVADDNG